MTLIVVCYAQISTQDVINEVLYQIWEFRVRVPHKAAFIALLIEAAQDAIFLLVRPSIRESSFALRACLQQRGHDSLDRAAV